MMEQEGLSLVSRGVGQDLLILIPAFAFIGFLFNGLGWVIFRDRFQRRLVNLISCLVIFCSFLVSSYYLYLLAQEGSEVFFYQKVFSWIYAGDFRADFGLVFDRLSAVMCMVVTLVGLLIHIYSIGYMGHDPSFARFFSYLNLFMFMMLVLVMGDNLVVMFVGWEGVGLCSYLLIGFWYEDWEKAKAGLKAFIVNRIGDLGFVLGILTIFWAFKTVEFIPLRETINSPYLSMANIKLLGTSVATLAGLFLFIGAVGKSAQIPLYVWLPDAMAGPTPVSALIHAATMVTAGVYMIARMNFLYIHSPFALTVVAFVGAITALYAGTIGLTQTDIKKVLAYSTVSQLGGMFLGLGVGAFSAGIFHLVTHAFFKALLFLGAGSVIVAFHHSEQNIMKMGGLSKILKWTYGTMVVGWLSIIGIPPFSGFFSKDEIIWKTFSSTNPFILGHHLNKVLYFIVICSAFVTAIYMTRLIALTFWGESRVDEHYKDKLSESPPVMIIPLVLLAVGSALVGFLGVPSSLFGNNLFEHWLEPVMTKFPQAHIEFPLGSELLLERGLMGLSITAGIIGILMVYYIYISKPGTAQKLAERFKILYQLSYNKYYVDEIYNASLVKPLISGSYYFLFRFVDVVVVDGFINGVAWLAQFIGNGIRRLQTGAVYSYILFFVMGMLLILAFYLVRL